MLCLVDTGYDEARIALQYFWPHIGWILSRCPIKEPDISVDAKSKQWPLDGWRILLREVDTTRLRVSSSHVLKSEIALCETDAPDETA